MARRVYGAPASADTKPEVQTPVADEYGSDIQAVAEQPVKEPQDDIKEVAMATPPSLTVPKPPRETDGKGKAGAFIIVTVLIALVLTAAGMFIYLKLFDGSRGARTSQAVAVRYFNAIASSDVKEIYACMPPEYKNTDISGLKDDLSKILSVQQTEGITFNNVKVVGEESCVDKKASLKMGLVNTYGKSMTIDDARIVMVSADIVYNGETTPTTFQVTVIKSGFKWYVYPADPVTSGASNNGVKPTETTEPSGTSGEGTSETTAATLTPTVGPTPTPVVTVAPYDELWLNDLKAGKFTLAGHDVVMPAKMSGGDECDEFCMTELIQLDMSRIAEASRIVPPNQIVSGQGTVGVPIYPVNEDWRTIVMDHWVLNIGNPTTSDINIDEGYVTKLYMEKSDVYPYPQLILPGGITFGCTLEQVQSVYGELTKYTPSGNDGLYQVENVQHKDDTDLPQYPVKGTSTTDVTVYRVSLNNRLADNKEYEDLNSLYLEFDSQNRLVAVEWYYFNIGTVA